MNLFRPLLLCSVLLSCCIAAAHVDAQVYSPDQGRVVGTVGAVLAPRDRVAPENRMLQERLDTLLPQLMKEADLDMWLVIAREYAEDPVYFTLVPQPSHAARRTTMLVFDRQPDGSVKRLAINRYPFGSPYESAWAGGDLASQWKALGELIGKHDPKRIGINVSSEWPVADGLTYGLHQQLLAALPAGYETRLVPAENLVVRWLETRSESERATYPHIVALARGVIAEAFSAQVITPGVTHTDDVAWYILQRFESLGLPVWFMPDVNFQRAGTACAMDAPFCGQEGVIQPGDVLHTDVGICYLKLCTDTQEMAYVARVGERDVPDGLRKALATGNRWQDLLTANFKSGSTGNQVLAATRRQVEAVGILSSTYSHPVGFFGHAPGPTIGMWDNQGDTVGQGDWPLHAMTVYAIEGNIKAPLPEWKGQQVQIKLEQTALFDGERVYYLAGRQTQWHVIR
ncbi:MAG: M24 family metallopeptidase [Pseudoxanthomonas sp.]